jgi:diadenosine tetraphosphate (Ap4A) HIT family hydrolase
MENNNCPLCSSVDPEQLIWEDEQTRVILAKEPGYPGFVRVIWKQHIQEMTDLTNAQRDQLMNLVYEVEGIVRQVMQPQKINLAALGNMVPHIHWHVIPRYVDDASFPGSVWSEKLRTTPETILQNRLTQESQLKKTLQEKLKEKISKSS